MGQQGCKIRGFGVGLWPEGSWGVADPGLPTPVAKQEEKESEDEESEEPDSTTGTPPRYGKICPFPSRFLPFPMFLHQPVLFSPTAAHQIRRTIILSNLAPTSTCLMLSGQ